MPTAATAAAPAAGGVVARLLRLHDFELLIFAILFVLLALCLAVAPLISEDAVSRRAAPLVI